MPLQRSYEDIRRQSAGDFGELKIRTLLQEGMRQKRYEVVYAAALSLWNNAAMIGAQGYYEYLAGKRADETLNAVATLSLE